MDAVFGMHAPAGLAVETVHGEEVQAGAKGLGQPLDLDGGKRRGPARRHRHAGGLRQLHRHVFVEDLAVVIARGQLGD